MKRILSLLAMLFVLPNLVSATDKNFYFDASANDGGDGSHPSPFNELSDVSWDDVHNNIISGNDVYLMLNKGETFLVPDNWAGWRFYAGGTPDNRIYVTGYGTGERPIIDARGDKRGIFLDGQLYGRNSGYITFDGLEIKDGFSAISGHDVSHIVVKNCKFHDFLLRCVTPGSHAVIGGAPGEGNEMYNCGRGTGGCDVCISKNDVIVSYNHLYGTKSNGDEGDRGIDGVIADSTNRVNSEAYNILIEHNEIHDHNDNYYGSYEDHGQEGRGEDGIDIKNAYNVTVRYNHIYNHKYQSGITVQMDSHDVDIYGNLFHDNFWPQIYLMDGASDYHRGNGVSVRNINIWSNLIYSGDSDGIRVARQSGTNPDPVKDVNIFNNVIAGNAQGEQSTTRSGVNVHFGCTGTVIKNNIFYKNRPDKTDYQQIHVSDSSTTALDNNIYYWPGHTSVVYWGSSGDKTIAELKVLGQEQGGSDEDPGLIDPDNNDYMLLDGSLCIGTGDDLGPDYNDLLHPFTDWTTTPPSVVTMQQEDDWVRGAYGYIGETHNCSEQGGFCCTGIQTCPGTDLGDYPDCTGTCCSESCQESPQTCHGQDYHCCNECVPGTEHPENDTDCPGVEVCCGECFSEPWERMEMEAESGTFSSPMTIGTDPQASGEAYVYTSAGYDGSADFTFIVEKAANYRLEARVMTPEPVAGRDSFFIGYDGQNVQGDDAYAWDTLQTGTFVWDNVSLRGPDGDYLFAEFDPKIWELSPGAHTFTFFGREEDTRLDQVALVRHSHRADKNPWNVCIEEHELIPFIDSWKYDSTTYPMWEIMEAVTLWSRGIGCT